MLTIDVDPTLVHLGPLALSWYGLAVAAAIAVGAWLTWREAARRGLPTECSPARTISQWRTSTATAIST